VPVTRVWAPRQPASAPDGEKDPEEKNGTAAAGSPHVLITRTPDGRLTLLQPIGSRRKDSVATAVPAGFAGYLITDGYTGYQHLLSRLAGIQQCAQHVIRRCRASRNSAPAACRTGPPTSSRSCAMPTPPSRRHAPAGTPPWTSRSSASCGNATTPRSRPGSSTTGYGTGTPETTPATHGTWLRDYREQVFLFTRNFAVSWTNNVSERGAKAAKRHQAVSGYWHSLATLARWCRLRSYLDTAAAHGVTALDAISSALAGKPWLPPLRAIHLCQFADPVNGHVTEVKRPGSTVAGGRG